MKIAELEAGQRGLEIEAKVIEKGEVREFMKFGRPGKVCTCVIEDDTGTIQLTLWDEQTGIVNQGDMIHVDDCTVKEYKGQKQVSVGRDGSITAMQ